VRFSILPVCILLAVAGSAATPPQDPPRFRSGVELTDVTVSVTDKNGHFVTGLHQEDFSIYEDGTLQRTSQFTAKRPPVSLGILLDASGSMNPDKLATARRALERLVTNLLDPEDELFFVEFGYSASMTQEWTTDRRAIQRALAEVQRPTGDTAMYDAIALALPTAQAGRHGKKALLVLSDGRDTKSAVSAQELRQSILESDVLVYALGIDTSLRTRPKERVDANTLRGITDGTGGRTEIVRGSVGLNRAIDSIAEELRSQYTLGYQSPAAPDGRWRSIRVEVRDRRLMVRARRGYTSH
jgi:Ca-activated chloride channel homolog